MTSENLPIKKEELFDGDFGDERKELSCLVCLKIFQFGFELTNHMEQCHPNFQGDLTLTANVPILNHSSSGKVTIKKEELFDEDLSGGDAKVNCIVCLEIFQTPIELTEHFEEFHPNFQEHLTLTDVSIENHSLKLVTKGTENVPMVSHSTDLAIKNDSVTKEELLDEDLAGEVAKIICTVCLDIFPTSNALAEHLNQTHSEGIAKTKEIDPHHIKTEVAELVPGTSTSPEQTEIDTKPHKSTKVKPRERFPCPICDKTLGTNSALKRHIKLHEGVKPSVCEICDKAFTTGRSLKVHLRAHTGERPFHCDFCNSTFIHKNTLLKHIRAHLGQKFSCDVCEESFAELKSIKKHKLTHVVTAEKSLVCQFCKKTFASDSELTVHERKHRGELPHVCKVCDKAFSIRAFLERHMLHHTGEKPIACAICSLRFTQKASMTRHMKTVHRIKKKHQ